MKKTVGELRKIMKFKDDTLPGDIALIATKNPDMLVYALVGEIDRDESRRDEWWHVRMTLFTVPPQSVVWTLRGPQMTGQEIFTMGGDERFMQTVVLPTRPKPERPPDKPAAVPIRRIK
ncbi:MAG: hypothetical protein LBU39_11860 [Desulfobulbaceae bacterium]|jgi:hypothetical protein|nr:hypothetical protein [Desulfobulbaceae bacterium]